MQKINGLGIYLFILISFVTVFNLVAGILLKVYLYKIILLVLIFVMKLLRIFAEITFGAIWNCWCLQWNFLLRPHYLHFWKYLTIWYAEKVLPYGKYSWFYFSLKCISISVPIFLKEYIFVSIQNTGLK